MSLSGMAETNGSRLSVCRSFTPELKHFYGYTDERFRVTLGRWEFPDLGTPVPTQAGNKLAVWPAQRMNKYGEVPLLAAKLPLNKPTKPLYLNPENLLDVCFIGFIGSAAIMKAGPELPDEMSKQARFAIVHYDVVKNILSPYEPVPITAL